MIRNVFGKIFSLLGPAQGGTQEQTVVAESQAGDSGGDAQDTGNLNNSALGGNDSVTEMTPDWSLWENIPLPPSPDGTASDIPGENQKSPCKAQVQKQTSPSKTPAKNQTSQEVPTESHLTDSNSGEEVKPHEFLLASESAAQENAGSTVPTPTKAQVTSPAPTKSQVMEQKSPNKMPVQKQTSPSKIPAESQLTNSTSSEEVKPHEFLLESEPTVQEKINDGSDVTEASDSIKPGVASPAHTKSQASSSTPTKVQSQGGESQVETGTEKLVEGGTEVAPGEQTGSGSLVDQQGEIPEIVVSLDVDVEEKKDLSGSERAEVKPVTEMEREDVEEVKEKDTKASGKKRPSSPGKKKFSEKPEDYLAYVKHMCANQRLIWAKQLIYKLGYLKGIKHSQIEEAVLDVYKVAVEKKSVGWITDARYFSELIFPTAWIDEHLQPLDRGGKWKNKPKNKQRKQRNTGGYQYEEPRHESRFGLVQDVRLLENPNLPVVRQNAGIKGRTDKAQQDTGNKENVNGTGQGADKKSKEKELDKIVTDFTNKIIDGALQIVAENCDGDKQSKKLAKDAWKKELDKTPRSRPEQLAMGFNYHSDVVVKESPRSETGEMIVGVAPVRPNTPRGRRDQLALGFSYHSEVIAQQSPRKSKSENDIEKCSRKSIGSSKKCISQVNGLENGDISPKTSPRSKSDETVAIGFSYNSDFLSKSLCSEDVDPNHDCRADLLEEGEAAVRPLETFPAGSVW